MRYQIDIEYKNKKGEPKQFAWVKEFNDKYEAKEFAQHQIKLNKFIDPVIDISIVK